MRRLPELVAVVASVAAIHVLVWLVRTLDAAGVPAFPFSDLHYDPAWSLPEGLSPELDSRLGFLSPGAFLGAAGLGALVPFAPALALRRRVPAGPLLLLAVAVLLGTVLGEADRLRDALAPGAAPDVWLRDGRLAAFPLDPGALGDRLAVGLGLSVGIAFGALLFGRWATATERRSAHPGWPPLVGAALLAASAAFLPEAARRAFALEFWLDWPARSGSGVRLDALRNALGWFLCLWILGSLALLAVRLRDLRAARPRPGSAPEGDPRPGFVSPVDGVRRTLLPLAIVAVAATAGFLHRLLPVYYALLAVMLAWATTLLGPPGKRRFPRRLVPDLSAAAAFSGALLLSASLALAFGDWPAAPGGSWPGPDAALPPVAAGAWAAVAGSAAAAALLALDVAGGRRRRR